MADSIGHPLPNSAKEWGTGLREVKSDPKKKTKKPTQLKRSNPSPKKKLKQASNWKFFFSFCMRELLEEQLKEMGMGGSIL